MTDELVPMEPTDLALRQAVPTEKIALIDAVATQLSLPPRNRGWLEKLQIGKLRKFHEQTVLSNEHKSRERLFSMLCDLRVEAARDGFAQIELRIRGTLQGETAVFFANRLKEVLEKLDGISKEFATNASKALAEAEELEHPKLKGRAVQRAEANVDRFYDSIDKLERNFEGILNHLEHGPVR